MHTTADDPKRYRSEEEVDTWRARDPIVRFQKYLKTKKLLKNKDIEKIEEEIKDEIQRAVEGAEALMKKFGDPLDMFSHTYAELPPNLVEQKDELSLELTSDKQEANHG